MKHNYLVVYMYNKIRISPICLMAAYDKKLLFRVCKLPLRNVDSPCILHAGLQKGQKCMVVIC
jgi:hypothetical protein